MRQRYQESPNKASTVNYVQMQLQVDQEALDSGEGMHILNVHVHAIPCINKYMAQLLIGGGMLGAKCTNWKVT